MKSLADHPRLRRLLVTAQQLLCAVGIYAAGAAVWRLGLGYRGRPGLGLVLMATAVVALVLARLRRPLERVVNGLAFGERADRYELVTGFLQRMAGGLPIDEVLPRLAEAAARSIRSDRSEVRVWLADGSMHRQSWPQPGITDASGTTVAVRHGGDAVGEIEVGLDDRALSVSDRRLLDELTGPAGLALSTVRLTYELRDRAIEIEAGNQQLRASRQRIIEARLSQQRQFQAEVDRRVRPHLLAAGQLLRSSPSQTDDTASLEDVRQHALDALEALRDLARGIYPPRLSEAGLVVALEGWADRSGLRIELRPSGDLARLRSTPDIEAATFFCAVTALGALGRAGAVPTTSIDVSDDAVELRVTAADGPAELPPEVTVDLIDRAEAFAGQADVAGVSGGPGIRVRLPLVGV